MLSESSPPSPPPAGGRAGLDDLLTEAGGEPAADLESRPTAELVRLMHEADRAVLPAVGAAVERIASAIDAVVARLERGGRLIYVGAGSSGRIAALDASECESTFAAAPGLVVALVAGGAFASPAEQEAAEDDRAAGARELAALGPGPADAVVVVSASGRTPYVLGAAEAARAAGALTVGIVCVEGSELGRLVEHEVPVVVGPEFLAGSTRLKAGTAQKLVLNMLSTISMIRLGKTFGNLMVGVLPANEKLRARVRRIVRTATGAPPERVEEALAAADGDAKVAIVSLLAGVDAAAARARLAETGGRVRPALGRGA
ncbi:MAG TPA: N-acetylmuramic acid 6-phosphate etherase [Gaiellaceae bacterium]|nr:N-acetylmuramic acid 6-phosphate etherase [Gaiellaceae bacterium]